MLEEEILQRYRSIAVVGASNNPERASYRVMKYLSECDYNTIPVNPNVDSVLGKKSFPNLKSVSEPIEIVEIFRRSEEVLPIVEEAIEVGAKVIWMQEGIVNEDTATRARAAGLTVVMDKCMRTEHARMIERQNW